MDVFPFEAEAEKQYIIQIAYLTFYDLHGRLKAWIENELRIHGNNMIPEGKILDHLQSQINDVSLFYAQQSNQRGILDKDTQNQIHNKYYDVLNEWMKYFFEKYSLSEESQAKLRYIVIHVANSGPKNSGIVIAGFGEKEYFPHCRSYDVGGVLSGHTIRFKHEQRQFDDISTNVSVAILPFAQSDEVATFINGVSPYLLNYMEQAFRKVFSEGGNLPNELYEDIISRLGLQTDETKELKDSLGQICQGAFEGALSKFREERWRQHSEPIFRATGFLNKDELAQMAETLINLESFRKRVGLEEETVGGPIDVAVITKGDGLIWIKRKHYFKPELNHHFFRNYFKIHPHVDLEGNQHEYNDQ